MSDPAPPATRRPPVAPLVVLAVAAIGGLGWWWHLHATAHLIDTDNAYVGGDLVPVEAQVAGTVTEVLADDTRAVTAGQPLLRLDPVDADLALARADADLAQAVRTVCGLQAAVAEAEALVQTREAELARAHSNRVRREAATALSEDELQNARDAERIAAAALAAANAALTAARTQVAGTDLAGHPAVRAAAERLRVAALDRERCAVLAPVSGVVARRSVQAGARILPGAPLMAIIAAERLWVDANLKEGQLADVRPGQRVTLNADRYGSDVVFHGIVVGLAPGTGAAFSLLPPQNASGNWVKVVQRLPVRIALDPAELAAHPLAVGLSMAVEIDTTAPVEAVPAQVANAAPAARLPAQVEERIAAIIAANIVAH